MSSHATIQAILHGVGAGACFASAAIQADGVAAVISGAVGGRLIVCAAIVIMTEFSRIKK